MMIDKKTDNYIDGYLRITGDLLKDEYVESMKTFSHHKEVNTHFHSVYVSYCVYRACEALGVKDEADIIRASLLHDFYLYEWYTVKHDEYHIFYHPKESVKNIIGHFGSLTDKQRDMILSHMFPIAKKMPNSVGAWLLTGADKYCAMSDYITKSKNFVGIYDEINRRIQNNAL